MDTDLMSVQLVFSGEDFGTPVTGEFVSLLMYLSVNLDVAIIRRSQFIQIVRSKNLMIMDKLSTLRIDKG